MVLLENMRDDIKLVAEGHSVLGRKIDNLGIELGGKIDKLDVRMSKVEGKMFVIEKKVDEGFELVLNHLDGLDREFVELKNDLKNNYEKKGHDVAWRKAIEERLSKVEKLLVSKKTARA